MSNHRSPERTAYIRTSVLSVSAGLFLQKGYSGTTIKDIAAVSGISAGSIMKVMNSKVTGNTARDAGKYTLTVTASGYFTGVATLDWYIEKAEQTIAVEDIAAIYGETGKKVMVAPGDYFGDVTYSVTKGEDVLRRDKTTGELTFLKAGEAEITISVAGDKNHKPATSKVAVTVEKATATITAKNKSGYVYDEAPQLTAPILNQDYTITGLIGEDTPEDTVTIVLSYDDTLNTRQRGTYPIIPSAEGEDSRYTFVFENGTLTLKNRPSYPPTYIINVDKTGNGTVSPSLKRANSGSTVTLTVKPDTGYVLETLTVTDENGGKLAVTAQRDGTYAFIMPECAVNVKAVFQEDLMPGFFTDVPAGSYYHDAVRWAVDNHVTGGIDDTHFAPYADCTRAQIVTMLYRTLGQYVYATGADAV